MTPQYTQLTPTQKMHAFANRFYLGGVKWEPQPGDYYTSTRADLELYRIVEITETEVVTEYCHSITAFTPPTPAEQARWSIEGFTTEGFGPNRLHVPLWILEKMK